MLFSSIGVGNDKSIKSEFDTASLIFVVAENFLFLITSLKISSYPGSSFKGNFPDSCSVEGCFKPKNKKDSFLENKIDWTEILHNSKLAGNQENIFSLSQTLLHTHIRFNIYPDGGVSRLRILGREAS